MLSLCLVLLSLSGCTKLLGGQTDMQGKVTTAAAGQGSTATVPIIFDGDQIVIELEAVRPDGSSRKVLALVNMGQSPPWLKQHLYNELQIDKGRKLVLRLGDLPIQVDASVVQTEPDRADLDRQFGAFFPAHKVEMVLQAGILSNYALILDYSNKKLTLTSAGKLHPQGVAVPIRVNARTGVAAVTATIDGKPFSFVIDCGSPYSWVRGSAATQWIEAHPNWKRAEGAVGLSNYNMLDYDFEKEGTVLRVPSVMLGPLALKDVGLLASGPLLGGFGDRLFGEVFWDSWQENAPGSVAGWLGANVLKQYQVTIDYANHMSYWLKRKEGDPNELDQVGITLVYKSGDYFIGGVVRKNGQPTEAGLSAGDKIMQVGGQAVHGLAREAVLSALHGTPGESRQIVVERDGSTIAQSASVIAF